MSRCVLSSAALQWFVGWVLCVVLDSTSLFYASRNHARFLLEVDSELANPGMIIDCLFGVSSVQVVPPVPTSSANHLCQYKVYL